MLNPCWVQFRIMLGSFPGVGQKVNILRRRRGKGEQNEAPVEPKGAQRRAKGAKKEPRGLPVGATFVHFFVIVAGFVLGLIF